MNGSERVGWVLSRFLRDRRAGGTALTAVLFTLMSLGGIAFASDHVWLVYQRDLLKAMTDAASVATTLALQKDKSVSEAQLETTATRYILANIPAGMRNQVKDTLEVTVTPHRAEGIVDVSATADLGGAIFGQWLWGKVASKTQVASGTEQIEVAGGIIEVALALDITASMNGYVGKRKKETKIKAVKEAARDLVEILADAGGDVAVGLVPWHHRVKFDQKTRTRWDDNRWALYPTQQRYPNPDNGKRPSESYTLPPKSTLPKSERAWKGCVDQRQTSGQDPPGLTAVLPKDAPFTMGFYSPTAPNNYRNDKRAKSIAFTCYPNQDFCYDDPSQIKKPRPRKWSPQEKCTDFPTILPLTTDMDTAKGSIKNLKAEGGATYLTLGVIWGHRLLAPTWLGVWGDPVHPIDLSQHEHAQKSLVLLTDGLDNFRPADVAENHLSQACRAAKDDGIKVYVIAVNKSRLFRSNRKNHYTEFGQSLVDCSSSYEDPGGQYIFFDNATPENLRGAFRQIGQQIKRFRRVY